MKTLRFYQVIYEDLVEVERWDKEGSYGVDYRDWPQGTFYTVYDDESLDGPELHGMENTTTQLDYPGELFLLEHPGGGTDVLRLNQGEGGDKWAGTVELVPIHKDTIRVVFSLLQCTVFDKIETEDLFENFIRKGVDGLCEQIQSAVYDGLRKLP